MTVQFDPTLLADATREAITGDQLVYVVDSSNIEARVLAWVAGHNSLLQQFRDKEDVYINFATKVYQRPLTKKLNPLERHVGKTCLVEGTLVLTQRGSIAIQDVLPSDQLWDGIEWVSHAGVIDQGMKEVISYDGITATPDHEVFCTDGRIRPLQQAQTAQVRLVQTGMGGQAVRFADCDFTADTPRQRLSLSDGPVRAERIGEMDLALQSRTWSDNLTAAQRCACFPSPCTAEGLRRGSAEMHQPEQLPLQQLRGPGDRVSLHNSIGCSAEDSGCIGSTAEGNGIGSPGQPRPLCNRQSSLGYAAGAGTEPQEHTVGNVLRTADADPRLLQSIRDSDSGQVCTPRHDGRANTGAGQAGNPAEAQGVATNARLVRVYDIANAGPRFRYTAGDKLVLNCVLGLGFQVGWKKLQSSLATNDQFPMWVEEPECRHMVNLYRSDNSPVVDYWAAAELAIYDMYQGNERQWGALQIYKNALIMPNGMALQYPHLRPSEPDEQGRIGWEYWNGKFFTNLYGGKLTENIVQALSRIVLFRQMLKIDTLFQSYGGESRVALSVHDEVVSVGPSFGAIYLGTDATGKEMWSNTGGADELFAKQVEIMRTPEAWCMDLPLDGEGGFDFQYSK